MRLGRVPPAVDVPGLADQASQSDDAVGQGDRGVDEPGAFLGAYQDLLEGPGNPRVGLHDDPTGARLE